MYYLLEHFSAITICIILMVLSVLISVLVLFTFRKFCAHLSLKDNHDVSDTIFSAASMLYSLIVAFVMVAVWEDYETQNSYIMQESALLEKVKLETITLEKPLHKEIIKNINLYAESEIANDPKGYVHLYHLRKLTETDDTSSSNALQNISSYVVDTIEINHMRYSTAQSHIPPFVWFVLLFGSVVTILLTCYFKSEFEYLYIILIAAMISTCLTVIYILDHPLAKAAGLDYNPLHEVIK